MYIKWNITGVIAFFILGAILWFFGPGFSTPLRGGLTMVLYGAVFFASFVVVKRR